MSKFKFVKPESLEQVFVLMEENPGYFLIAGGTDIMVQLKEKFIHPALIIDVGNLQELKGIQEKGGFVRVGAAVTFTELVESDVIQRYAPVLSEAAHTVGSPQIRNQGTIGGNIANASPAADTVTALVALEAMATLNSATGSRSVLVGELLCGAGKTNILPQEIITEITFKIPPAGSKTGFIKLGRRKALAIARMNLAIILTVKDERINYARVALGAVGTNPRRFLVLEDTLIGQKPTESLIDKFVVEAENEVIRVLGSRPSAVYKCKAVQGIARNLLSNLLKDSRKGVE